MVLSDLADTLVQNRLATALLGDQTHYTGLAGSAFYRWFTDPAERLLYPKRTTRTRAGSRRRACGRR
jgi:hypothetical protein